MISEIKYKGFAASPSDYECLDGDLAVVVGLVPEDGALKPVAPPHSIFTLAAGQRVVALHETSSFKHYIVQDEDNNLYWRTLENSNLRLLNSFTGAEIYQVTTIGNTIVALCDDGMHYMLWNADDKAYIFLGNKIPECPISFGLQGESKRYSELNDKTFDITYDEQRNTAPFNDFTEENKQKITAQVLAKVNKFVAQVSIDDNKFIFPFFVRYAYRLYDDSLIHHSAPILMMPCTSTNPMVYAPSNTLGNTSATLDIYTISATLDYQPLISPEGIEELKKWKDVVKSVDIFISAPFYTYDQSGYCERFNALPISYFFGNFKPKGGGLDDAKISSTYQPWNLQTLHSYDYGAHNIQWGVELPLIAKADIDAKIRDCSSFYKLATIDIEDLPISRVVVPIEEGSLSSIVAKEVMTDDYQTHDVLIPSFAQTYNSRLNIANIERKLFKGYDTASQVCYGNGWIAYYGTSFNDDAFLPATNVKIYTKWKSDKQYTLRNDCSIQLSQRLDSYRYLFYPDTAASEMVLTADGVGTKRLELQPHSGLNGSVYFAGLYIGIEDHTWDIDTTPLEDEYPIVALPNKVYTSEVNNPFFFPLLGINTVGAGEIIGVSTAAKALSEGQFGQFPLYAFTTDGVWALEVSATGSYSAKQPITRDICLGRESITQIDSAVLFATARGIMLLSGSQSICISDILDSELPSHISQMPKAVNIFTRFTSLAEGNVSYVSFRDFIANCRMIYDYINQRIIVINPDYLYAYVYSFDSKSWGIIASNLLSVVPSYPEALAMNEHNELVNMSCSDTSSAIPIFFITRAIKLDRDILKTLDTIIQRGYFKDGHIMTALYGSRDMYNWTLVATSQNHYLRGFRGTPYKYFKILGVGSLDIEESISGCSVQYELRQTNQLR